MINLFIKAVVKTLFLFLCMYKYVSKPCGFNNILHYVSDYAYNLYETSIFFLLLALSGFVFKWHFLLQIMYFQICFSLSAQYVHFKPFRKWCINGPSFSFSGYDTICLVTYFWQGLHIGLVVFVKPLTKNK